MTALFGGQPDVTRRFRLHTSHGKSSGQGNCNDQRIHRIGVGDLLQWHVCGYPEPTQSDEHGI